MKGFRSTINTPKNATTVNNKHAVSTALLIEYIIFQITPRCMLIVMLSSFSQPVGRIKALSLTVDLRGLVGGVSTGILSAPCRAGRVPCIPIMGKKRSEPRGRQFVEDCAHIQLVLQLMVHSFSPIRAACYYINRQKVLGPRGGGGGG